MAAAEAFEFICNLKNCMHSLQQVIDFVQYIEYVIQLNLVSEFVSWKYVIFFLTFLPYFWSSKTHWVWLFVTI